MADQQIGGLPGIAAANNGGAPNRSNINGAGGSNGTNSIDPQWGYLDNDQLSISAMRTRLTAIDAAFYTAAKLNTMTFNDMVYAIRVNDNPLTIKQ